MYIPPEYTRSRPRRRFPRDRGQRPLRETYRSSVSIRSRIPPPLVVNLFIIRTYPHNIHVLTIHGAHNTQVYPCLGCVFVRQKFVYVSVYVYRAADAYSQECLIRGWVGGTFFFLQIFGSSAKRGSKKKKKCIFVREFSRSVRSNLYSLKIRRPMTDLARSVNNNDSRCIRTAVTSAGQFI